MDIPQCDVVMFFDYPADRKTFEYILEMAQPKGLHFMNYELKIFDEQNLLKTFVGMLKFSAHNNGGQFELVRCASYLGKSIEVIKRLLDLFENAGAIKILEKNSSFYLIEFREGDYSSLLESSEYLEIFDMCEECDLFRQFLLEENLEQLFS